MASNLRLKSKRTGLEKHQLSIGDLEKKGDANLKEHYCPIEVFEPDSATVDGLIDLMIAEDIIPKKGDKTAAQLVTAYIDRYHSAMEGLIMLLIDEGLITEEKLKIAIEVYHASIRHFGKRAVSFEEVQQFRVNMIRQRLQKFHIYKPRVWDDLEALIPAGYK